MMRYFGPESGGMTLAEIVVLGHLDAGQHRVVRPIIDSLVHQLQQQTEPRFAPPMTQDADNA